jgi:hypothetical protein
MEQAETANLMASADLKGAQAEKVKVETAGVGFRGRA